MRHYYILKEQQLLHKINGPHHLFSLGRPMVHVLAPSPYDLRWGKAAADHISRSCHVIAIVSTLRLHCSTAENQRKRDCSRSFQSAATVLILSFRLRRSSAKISPCSPSPPSSFACNRARQRAHGAGEQRDCRSTRR
jgi:hypothetical protein